MMNIADVWPDLESAPPTGQVVDHRCVICSKAIKVEVGKDCPEDWLTTLLSLVACAACSLEEKGRHDAIEEQHKLVASLGLKKQQLRAAKRLAADPDYKVRIKAEVNRVKLEAHVREATEALNDFKNSREK